MGLLAVAGVAGCASPLAPRLPPLRSPFAAETVRVDTVAPGLVHYDIWSARGPWAIQVLDADRAACWSAVALKAGNQAVGRASARSLLQSLADTSRAFVGGGVNADFFLFEPPGVPIGLHVTGGRVIAGPTIRPVIAFDSTGTPWIGVAQASGWVRLGPDSLPLAGWNQRRGPGLRLFDARWGPATGAAPGTIEVTAGGTPLRVQSIDTSLAGVSIPPEGIVLAADTSSSGALRARLLAARAGEPVSWRVWLTTGRPQGPPLQISEGVGGRPILLRDSVPAPDLDTAGGPSFAPVRHPRTAVGVAARGRRLMLVTVDGRQPPFSDGMTLRELADLMRGLGARDAINLDGGGSTTLLMNRAGIMATANRPSDRMERPVANALALVQRACSFSAKE